MNAARDDCEFCDIVAGRAPAEVVETWSGLALAIVPLDPVVPGHLIVIPAAHVLDAGTDPWLTGEVARCAAELGAGSDSPDFNLITSAGHLATQTVPHLHWHYVPRHPGDGLLLPWGGQR